MMSVPWDLALSIGAALIAALWLSPLAAVVVGLGVMVLALSASLAQVLTAAASAQNLTTVAHEVLQLQKRVEQLEAAREREWTERLEREYEEREEDMAAYMTAEEIAEAEKAGAERHAKQRAEGRALKKARS